MSRLTALGIKSSLTTREAIELANMNDKIYLNISNGMETKVLAEAGEFYLVAYKGCQPVVRTKAEFIRDYRELKWGTGRNPYERK